MNMRRIINSDRGGYTFSRLARDEQEADLEATVNSSVHTAADDWDEFLGDRKSGSSSSKPYPYVLSEAMHSSGDVGISTADADDPSRDHSLTDRGMEMEVTK